MKEMVAIIDYKFSEDIMKRITLLTGIALCAISSIFAGGSKEAKSGEGVVITYPTYRVGSHLSAKSETLLVNGFNEKFKGQYTVEIEELPSDQSYVEKMKVLASANSLPSVVEGKNGVLTLAIKTNSAIDLNPYLEADPEFAAQIGDGAIKSNTIDGKVYTISNGNCLIGYFYNKKQFEAAGITPAKTWPEFMSNLQALKDSGYTPISMMTGENCWTTNLLLAAMVGTTEEGNVFMNTKYPTDYNTPEFKFALNNIKTILTDYSTKDAIGAKYDIAANHFLQGKTSIICNGPWMTGDFSNEAKASKDIMGNIGVALYPENGLIAAYEIGYAVCASDKEGQDAAWEFIKYKTNADSQLLMLEEAGTLPLTGNVKMSNEYVQNHPLVAGLIELSKDSKHEFMTLDAISYASVISAMSRDYPSLAASDITVDEMIQDMNDAAIKSK
jgi:raffinose/stachyose/melibiose transport system substrate-binding protein